MNPQSKRELILRQSKENIAHLDRSIIALQYSYSKCTAIIEKEEYDFDDQESLEALTSRFARTSDILTQKVLKSLFYLIQEKPQTFIDAANLLEKIGIVDQAENLMNIRELRNQISHEYTILDLKELFKDVLKFVPMLERIIQTTKEYIEKKFP